MGHICLSETFDMVLLRVRTSTICFLILFQLATNELLLKNIGTAARAIQKINSSNIAQLGKKKQDVSFFQINNVYLMTQVTRYGAIYLELLENPLGSALGISLELSIYFNLYPSPCHNTDTVYSVQ